MGGGHDSEGGLLTREDDEEPLPHDDSTEVECNHYGREGTVDKGAVYEDVDVEQMRA